MNRLQPRAARGAQPASGSWLTYNGAGDSAETIEMILIHDNLAGGSLHQHDLYIRCQDEADSSNQAVLGPWEYDRDLNISIVRNPLLSRKV
ncbi:MAG: hypothetical protein PHQ55_05955 [Eubacteriales bacterium]|nr:hypothetical protein [Eubacteriales bacterium]MDD3198099.1 hypothetical protein [Eubacteriales bacterium]MDD3504876.1 hypothetical protein [Eubacteriales bacterium]MDD4682697.1 hypothetical protein [Eubacteriales bacterium]